MRLGDRFDLNLRVGVGGTASVYRALDGKSGTHAAVKVLHPSLRDEPVHVERFWTEAELLGVVDHPGIPKLRASSGESEQVLWFATDFAEGGSLTGWITRGIRTEEVITAGMELCVTLAHLHTLGIVHRDVKPDNVLFDSDAAAMLCDFGIARHPDVRRTCVGDVMGTPSYMPPEQATDPGAAGPTADIFALGVTLFAAASRRSGLELFYDQTRVEALAALAPGLREVVDRATRPLPGDRFPSADALQWALSDLL